MINKNNVAGLFAMLLIVSCSMEESSETASSEDGQIFFNEFMECKFGPDMSQENLTAMISEWQELITDDSLMGAWGYAPASDSNSDGGSGWWELQWTSKENADAAWSDWGENEAAMKWNEKYQGVMQCDGPGRYAFDGVFPINPDTYGETSEDGYFYSEFYGCTYNDGSSSADLKEFTPGFVSAVAASDYEDTRYSYGNYLSTDSENPGFLWANFTASKEMNDKATASFEADVREKMFPLFSEFASCSDTPNVYHSWTLYLAGNEFMPTFSEKE